MKQLSKCGDKLDRIGPFALIKQDMPFNETPNDGFYTKQTAIFADSTKGECAIDQCSLF